METKIHHFAETDQYLVISENKIIIICNTEDEAKAYVPIFKVGDYVDIPDEDAINCRIKDVDRTIEGYLYYTVEGSYFHDFDQEELVIAHNPPAD